MDLGLFFFEEADEFVVLLDGFERLDVDGLAGRAGAVNHAGDAALEFAAHGDDEAVAANGDEVFLRGAVGGELAQRGAEALFDDALLAFLLATNAAEFRRGVVGQSAVGLNGALDGFGQRTERCWSAPRRALRGRGVCRRGARAGDCKSACQAATSLARRATACSSLASSAAPGIWALAANCVGSKRPPRGMETCSVSSRRTSPVS